MHIVYVNMFPKQQEGKDILLTESKSKILATLHRQYAIYVYYKYHKQYMVHTLPCTHAYTHTHTQPSHQFGVGEGVGKF